MATRAARPRPVRERPGLSERALATVMSPLISGVAAFNRWRLPARTTEHPLLTGVHQPMTEELTLTDLPVDGAIPPELDGRYLRIGPNPISADPRSYHLFTGDGMVHGLRLEGGRAHWYRNRWIRSEEVARARGVSAAPGPRHIFDTVNTNVVAIGGAAHALVEAGSTPVRLDETLDGQRYTDLHGTLPGSFTAHPRRDGAGRLHALCYEATDPRRLRYNRIGRDGRVERTVTIGVADGPLVHDCAITGRFVVILDLPLTLSVAQVMRGTGFPYRWNPRHPARIGLLPFDGTAADVTWVPVAPAFAFHAANACDLPDGRVALDLVAYDRMFADVNAGPDERPRGLERWLIDPARGTVEQVMLDPTEQEFPRIDERRTGLSHRYVYALALPPRDQAALVGEAPLLKHDLTAGTRSEHRFGAGRIPGEFVFVPRGPDAGEDDGWLMGLVIEADGAATALEILDARDIAAAPVAAVRLPHRVPPGFHGNWLAG